MTDKRYRELLSTLKKDGKGRFNTLDVLKLLRQECEIVEMLSKGKA